MTTNLLAAAAMAALLAALGLTPGSAAAAGRDPAAGPPVSAADVVLFIDAAPCAGAADVAEIAVQQEPMALADVLRALRLEAAHRGADGVRDIRVAPGGEGRFRVSGTAVRCPSAAAPAMPPPDGALQPRPRGAPQGAADPASPDPAVAGFLGERFLAILAGAERVETVHLGGRGAAHGRVIQDFAVVGGGRALNADEIAALRRMILDPASYMFGSSKRCPFIADAGFVLHRGEETASIALATRCNLWSFAPGGGGAGRPAIEDFDPVADRLKALAAVALGKK